LRRVSSRSNPVSCVVMAVRPSRRSSVHMRR
jgi:hypothetical protein